MAIITNPITGVEFDDFTGDSTKRYVAVESNGVVRDPRGEKWPAGEGLPHRPQPYEFYELKPFVGAGYDSELFYVKSEHRLESYTPKPPTGHPQGVYKTVQTLHLLPKADLKNNAFEYFSQAQRGVYPQDPTYEKMLSIAQKALESPGSGNPEIGTTELFAGIVEKDKRIAAALLNNRSRLEELNKQIDGLEIDQNGELKLDEEGKVVTPPILYFSRMLTTTESGWVNGVE